MMMTLYHSLQWCIYKAKLTMEREREKKESEKKRECPRLVIFFFFFFNFCLFFINKPPMRSHY
jgi:hypothetical protein